MTSPRRFEHDLPVLLADMYFAGTPEYRDDLVQQIARVRQRPAWTVPERWLPMDLATKALPGATRIPWRIVGVLVVAAVFFSHLHYTIDVIGAYAFAYALFCLRERPSASSTAAG